MDEHEFKERTKNLALRIIRLVDALPSTSSGRAIGNQLVRCGTSVGANYRAACRGRSTVDVISKLGVVEEEADETLYWLELAVDAGLIQADQVRDLIREADEILAMTVASIKTLRSRSIQNPKSKI